MARNIEIKARARNFERQARLAASLSDRPSQELAQEDTFFVVPQGRLKLRVLGDGSGELIQYQRADACGPKSSHYQRVPAPDPAALAHALGEALGVRAVVRKRRTVHFCGQTRIHLDEVSGLGSYLELEVVLSDDQEQAFGVAIAEELMQALEIAPDDLIEGAYVDLL